MSMSYKEVPQGLPKEELRKYATGIDLVGNFVDSLEMKGLLPKRFAKAVERSPARARSSESLPLRLKPMPFEIEIPEVSEAVYAETRKAVEATGAFITSIRSLTMEDLLREDEEREKRGEPRRLGYVNSSETMRSTFPPKMEVFINPKAVRIEGSNNLSTDEQKKKITEAAASFKEQLPEGVRSFVDLHMVDPSTYSQLEDAWMDAGNGLLFPDYFVRTDIQTDVGGSVARVGRGGPSYRRHVRDWGRDDGLGDVFAVPVGVLPQKLAA